MALHSTWALGLGLVSSNNNIMSFMCYDGQLRRQARLRREYLYRKSIEDQERTILERKRKIQAAIEGSEIV